MHTKLDKMGKGYTKLLIIIYCVLSSMHGQAGNSDIIKKPCQRPPMDLPKEEYNKRVEAWAKEFEKENKAFELDRPYNVCGGVITQRSNYIIRPDAPADLVVISIHGFNCDGEQFQDLGRDLSLNHNVNWFNIVLPGHGEDRSNAKSRTAENMMKEVAKIVDFAKSTGKKVVLVGQSTGGVLAFGEAVRPENKNCIDGLAMVEPALMVNSTITAGACITSAFVEGTAQLLPITPIVNASQAIVNKLREDISPALGCQIDEIRLAIEKRAAGDNYFCPGQNDSMSMSRPDIVDLCDDLNMPTLMINRPDDAVVDYRLNERCGKTNPGSITYQEMKLGGQHAETPLDNSSDEGKAIKNFFLNVIGRNPNQQLGNKNPSNKDYVDSVDTFGSLVNHLHDNDLENGTFGRNGPLAKKMRREIDMDLLTTGEKKLGNVLVQANIVENRVVKSFLQSEEDKIEKLVCYDDQCAAAKENIRALYQEMEKIVASHRFQLEKREVRFSVMEEIYKYLSSGELVKKTSKDVEATREQVPKIIQESFGLFQNYRNKFYNNRPEFKTIVSPATMGTSLATTK